eukprot:5570142-Heterocapsa_arctica.AAC.1
MHHLRSICEAPERSGGSVHRHPGLWDVQILEEAASQTRAIPAGDGDHLRQEQEPIGSGGTAGG